MLVVVVDVACDEAFELAFVPDDGPTGANSPIFSTLLAAGQHLEGVGRDPVDELGGDALAAAVLSYNEA